MLKVKEKGIIHNGNQKKEGIHQIKKTLSQKLSQE